MKKENFAKIRTIIFCATEGERDNIVTPALKEAGMVGDKGVWVVVTGVGKVNATSVSAAVLACFSGSNTGLNVYNVGVCGGNAVALKKTPCSAVGMVFDNDFDTSAVDGLPFDKPSLRLTDGKDPLLCFTTDRFETCESRLSTGFTEAIDPVVGPIKKPLRPLSSSPYYVDMELFGIAKVCKMFQFRLTAIKSVSDVVGSDSQSEQYGGSDFLIACTRASKMLCELLSVDRDVEGTKKDVKSKG